MEPLIKIIVVVLLVGFCLAAANKWLAELLERWALAVFNVLVIFAFLYWALAELGLIRRIW